jgi:hypothetical protein
MGAYTLATGKTHFEILKKLIKNFAPTSQYSTCARQVSQKIDIFCGLCEKIKKNVLYKVIFKYQILSFYTCHKKCQLFVQWLSEHMNIETYASNFLSNFLNIFKIYLNQNFKTGSIWSHVLKHHPSATTIQIRSEYVKISFLACMMSWIGCQLGLLILLSE